MVHAAELGLNISQAVDCGSKSRPLAGAGLKAVLIRHRKAAIADTHRKGHEPPTSSDQARKTLAGINRRFERFAFRATRARAACGLSDVSGGAWRGHLPRRRPGPLAQAGDRAGVWLPHEAVA